MCVTQLYVCAACGVKAAAPPPAVDGRTVSGLRDSVDGRLGAPPFPVFGILATFVYGRACVRVRACVRACVCVCAGPIPLAKVRRLSPVRRRSRVMNSNKSTT